MNDAPAPANESQHNTTTASGKKISRDELERMTSQLIRTLHKRSTSTRFKPSGHDSPRLKYARACITAIAAYGGLLKDSELEALEKRIAELEKTRLRE